MYYAQVLEHGLVNLILAGEKVSGAHPTGADYDARFDALCALPTGRLVRTAGDAMRMTEDALRLCARAKATRNRLAHSFFRDYSLDAMTAEGMQRMLDDVDEARSLFRTADAAASEATLGLLAPYGVTPAVVDRYAEQMRRDAGQ
jgi:hypothetical protein